MYLMRNESIYTKDINLTYKMYKGVVFNGNVRIVNFWDIKRNTTNMINRYKYDKILVHLKEE